MSKLKSMKIFCSAARTLNFSKTADKLHISPAMVSKHISQLESHLGVCLLNRTTRRIELTEKGRAYHVQCQQLLDSLAELDSSVRGDNQANEGRLRLSVPMDYGVNVLAPLITDYLLQYPRVNIDVVYDDNFSDLIGEGFDLAIRIGEHFPNSSLVAKRLANTGAVLCASPEYLQCHPLPNQLEDLRQHNCIQYSNAVDRRQWRLTGPAGEEHVSINGRLRSNNGHSMLTAVQGGLGIAMLPLFLAEKPLAQGLLQQVLPAYHVAGWGIYTIYPRLSYLPARVRTFVNFIEQRLALDNNNLNIIRAGMKSVHGSSIGYHAVES